MSKIIRVIRTITVAAAAALIGGLIGSLIARISVERFALVEGPPAGVLFVLSIGIFGLLGFGLGLLYSLRQGRESSSE